MSLGSIVRRLLWSHCGVMFLWFSTFLHICFFDPLYLKWQSLPVVLTDWLWERNPFWWPCKRLWALLGPLMHTPTPCFLLSLWKDISGCDLATHQVVCSVSFCFPKCTKVQACGSFLSCRCGQAFCICSAAICWVHSFCHWEHTKRTSTGGWGYISVRHEAWWECLWASCRHPRARCLQKTSWWSPWSD